METTAFHVKFSSSRDHFEKALKFLRCSLTYTYFNLFNFHRRKCFSIIFCFSLMPSYWLLQSELLLISEWTNQKAKERKLGTLSVFLKRSIEYFDWEWLVDHLNDLFIVNQLIIKYRCNHVTSGFNCLIIEFLIDRLLYWLFGLIWSINRQIHWLIWLISSVGIKAVAILLPLLGVTWIFGVLAIGPAARPMQIIFAICNGLQACYDRRMPLNNHSLLSILSDFFMIFS